MHARVKTPESGVRDRQEDYSKKVHDLHMVEGWWWDATAFQPRPDQPLSPGSPALPFIWKWSDVGPLVEEMGDPSLGVGLGQGAKKAERRVLVLRNPGMGGKYAITNTLFGDLQVVKKGESAPTHRHTTAAIRFIFSGAGGWTTVEGERADMLPGDVIISQPLGWHDHGNDGPDDCILFDILDIPLLTSLTTACWDFDYVKVTGDKNRTDQALTWPKNYSNNLYQTGGIIPKFVGSSRPDRSPMLSYKWQAIRESLNRLRSEAGSPYDGIFVELSNPATGQSATSTMSICAQLLRPRETTLSHRENINTIYIVAEGEGHTQVGDTRIDWSKNDIFAVPSWYWHHHENDSQKDAVLYSVSDSPVMEKLGLYCENRKTKDGKTEFLGWGAGQLVYK